MQSDGGVGSTAAGKRVVTYIGRRLGRLYGYVSVWGGGRRGAAAGGGISYRSTKQRSMFVELHEFGIWRSGPSPQKSKGPGDCLCRAINHRKTTRSIRDDPV